MKYLAQQNTATLWVLAVTVAILAMIIAIGLVVTKRRVKKKLPGQDTEVES